MNSGAPEESAVPTLLVREKNLDFKYNNNESTVPSISFIYFLFCLFVSLMVFNATFNNISVISWRSVLLVEETEGPGENHRPVSSR